MQQAGWLNVWKPVSVGTRAITNILQAILPGAVPRWAVGPNKAPKAGHVGTLDTAAAGVVPLALGGATRLIPYLPTAKSYDALVKLGIATTSDDLSGVVVAQAGLSDTQASTAAATAPAVLSRFVGHILQQAPNLSAVWINGRRSYKMALEAARESGSAGPSRTPLPLVTPHRRVFVRRIGVGSWCSSQPSVAAAAQKYPAPQGAAAPSDQTPSSPRTLASAARVRGTGRSLVSTAGTPFFEEATLATLPSQLWLRARLSQQASRIPRLGRSTRCDTDTQGTASPVPSYSQPAPPCAAAPAPAPAVTPPQGEAPPPGCGYPELHLSVDCGPGVYIRSIARDLGSELGVPATLAALTRTSASGFDASTAVHMLDLRQGWIPQLSIAPDLPFAHLPAVAVGRLHRKDLLHLFVRRVPRGFLPLVDGGTGNARGAAGQGSGVQDTEEDSCDSCEAAGADGGASVAGDKKSGAPPALDWSIAGWGMPPVAPRETSALQVAALDEGDVEELVHVWRQTTQALVPATVIQGPPTPEVAERLVAGYVNEGSSCSAPELNPSAPSRTTPRIASGLDLGYVRVYAAVATPVTDSMASELLQVAGSAGCLGRVSLRRVHQGSPSSELLPSRTPARPALVAALEQVPLEEGVGATQPGVPDAAEGAHWAFLGLARVVPSSLLYPQAAARLQQWQQVEGAAGPDVYIMRAVTVI